MKECIFSLASSLETEGLDSVYIGEYYGKPCVEIRDEELDGGVFETIFSVLHDHGTQIIVSSDPEKTGVIVRVVPND